MLRHSLPLVYGLGRRRQQERVRRPAFAINGSKRSCGEWEMNRWFLNHLIIRNISVRKLLSSHDRKTLKTKLNYGRMMKVTKRFFVILSAAAFLAGCSGDAPTQRYECDYLTFESVGEKYLAGPTPAGENLYDGHADQYTGYLDEATGLKMWINEAPVKTDDEEVMVCNFWNGGIAISQWNYMTNEGFETPYRNQCSVYCKASSGNGGHNGSKTFGIVYYSAWSSPPALSFKDSETERVFDHLWVANSTIAVKMMEEGDELGARVLTYKDKDWLKLTINGYDKAGDKRVVEFYLADFRTSNAGGIVRKWTKVNLSTLGAINRLEFIITGSDEGEWGLNTPSYFCFDDVAIRREVLSGQ